ncbi:MAG: MBL fold metallo-hydrolase [Chitinispirillaceae bacterium]|nr:MBL fold metallo-hydrolase [Chitinispirillaceae bacterium]
MTLTFLGTGTSHGVPPIDCMLQQYASCPQGVCRQSMLDPKHRRTRSSILLRWEGASVLIDSGPDFREQCLRENIPDINAVLITHSHADHIYGIPDIRSYTRHHPIPFFGSHESIAKIRYAFPYIFDPETPVGGGIPRITTTAVDAPFALFDHTVIPIRVNHLELDGCFGFRIGPLSYIPDMKSIAPDELKKLSGTTFLVLNCLRRGPPHPSHLTLRESIELARAIAPQRCYFIHMSHDIHYELDRAGLDPWMDFAWDGLSVEI